MSKSELNATAASLLGFLHEGPETGWDLVEAVEASVGYFWNVTRSQVYRELKTLAAQGYVTAKRAGVRDKVPYAITAAGKAAFAAWLASEPGPEILRLPVVVTVFFGRHLPPEQLRRHLEKSRTEHRDRLEKYRTLKAEGVPDADDFQLSTLELGMAYEVAVLGWLDTLPWLKEATKKAPTRNPGRRGS